MRWMLTYLKKINKKGEREMKGEEMPAVRPDGVKGTEGTLRWM